MDKNIKQLQPFVLWFTELEVILHPQTSLELGQGVHIQYNSKLMHKCKHVMHPIESKYILSVNGQSRPP